MRPDASLLWAVNNSLEIFHFFNLEIKNVAEKNVKSDKG